MLEKFSGLKVAFASASQLLVCFCSVGLSLGDTEADEALKYLERFGYVAQPPSFGPSDPQGPQNSPGIGASVNISEAVSKFQNFAGLKESGELNSETLEFMKKPRCGVKDFFIQSDPYNNISAPYRTLNKWVTKTVLSWRVTKFSSKMTRSEVINSVWKAFQFWSSVTNLKFFEKTTGEVDIPIEFVSYGHGDSFPFDGPGGTLAHAFFPEVGDIHVDETEGWTLDSNQGTNFLQTLTHEIGHSIGLDHSRNNEAVMYPFASSYNRNFKLHQDDINGAQSLYGRPSSTTPRPVTPKEVPGRPSTYPPIPTFKCPDINTNTRGREGAAILDGIQTWSACSLKCSKSPKCRYWTWHHEGAQEYAYRCVLMTDTLTTVEDPNAISGTKKCFCPMQSTNTRNRKDSEMIGTVSSWEACAQRCSQRSNCNFWTWHPASAGDFGLRCILMTGYDTLVADSNAVSGRKVCK